jgi:hypothetical protein
LSRSLTIATLLPGGDVVIGFHRAGSAKRAAHAWVEVSGVALLSAPNEALEFHEIARLKHTEAHGGDSHDRGGHGIVRDN